MTSSFSGIHGVRAQDAMVTESPGSIVDRSLEHLGQSDRAIIALRRCLIGAARDAMHGQFPQTAKGREIYLARPHQALRDDATDFLDVPEIRQALKAPDKH